MAGKTHIGKQDESLEESGIIVSDTDPSVLVERMTWINTTENKLKMYIGGTTRVLAESLFSETVPIPVDGILDGGKFVSYGGTVTEDFNLSFANFFDGLECRVFASNNLTNVLQQIGFDFSGISSDLINDGSYFLVYSPKNLNKYHVYFDYDGAGNNTPIVADSTPIQVAINPGKFETTELTVPAGSGITSGSYFEFYSTNDVTAYYLWYNVDGAGGDPLIPGKIGVQVPITSSDPDTLVATETADSLDLLSDFSAEANSNVVTLTNNTFGPASDVANVSVSGLLVSQLYDGSNPDTPEELAVLVSDAMSLDLQFATDYALNNISLATFVFEAINPGLADSPENFDMVTPPVFSVPVPGSGPLLVAFPAEARFDDANATTIPAQTNRLYTIVKMQNFIYITFKDFAI